MSTPPPPPPPPPRPSRGLTDALEDAASATPRPTAPSLLTPSALGLGAHPGALVVGAPPAVATAIPTSPLAAVFINHHVPIVLTLQPPNFSQWRTLFEVMFQKSGVLAHLNGAPCRADPAWLQDDAHILSWLYTRVSPEIFGLIHQRHATAAEVWASIISLFMENQEHQAVFLATEFRRIEQGSSSVIAYSGRVKECADRLADLGQSVTDREPILNMLRGLHPRLRYAIPILTMQTPFPSFLRCRVFLLLEESRQTADTTSETALHATRTPAPPNSGGGGNPRCQGGGNSGGAATAAKARPWTPLAVAHTPAGHPHRTSPPPSRHPTSRPGPAWFMRGRCRGVRMLRARACSDHALVLHIPFAGVASHYSNAPPSYGAPHPIPPSAPPVQWTAGAVPPHPLYGTRPTSGAGGSSPAWDQSALVHALNSMHVQQPQPALPTADWYLDNGHLRPHGVLLWYAFHIVPLYFFCYYSW